MLHVCCIICKSSWWLTKFQACYKTSNQASSHTTALLPKLVAAGGMNMSWQAGILQGIGGRVERDLCMGWCQLGLIRQDFDNDGADITVNNSRVMFSKDNIIYWWLRQRQSYHYFEISVISEYSMCLTYHVILATSSFNNLKTERLQWSNIYI